jgi:predicted permease
MPAADVAIEFDATIVFLLLALSLATGTIAGLLPGLRAARTGSRQMKIGPLQAVPRAAIARGLLIIQVAVAVILVVGATLLVKTFVNLGRADVGFAYEPVQLFKVQFAGQIPVDSGVASRLQQKIRSLPGVRAVGISAHHLINDRTDRWRISLPIEGSAGSVPHQTYVNRVGGDFFDAMGIPLRSGRLFGPAETGAGSPPAVINETFARTFLRDREPLGRRVNGHVIVGVVADTKYGSLRDPAPPTMFVPFSGDLPRSISVQFRTETAAPGMSHLVRRAVHEIVPNAAIYGLITAEEQIGRALQRERFLASVTTLFGGLALLVSTLAIFGSTAFAVSLRTREVAIRVALGARSSTVMLLIAREPLLLALVGASLGTTVALSLAPLLQALLYGVQPIDSVSFAGTAFLVIACATVGSVFAARRALRVEPATALKSV